MITHEGLIASWREAAKILGEWGGRETEARVIRMCADQLAELHPAESPHRIGPDGVCVDPECGWTADDEAAYHVARKGLWNQPAPRPPSDPPCARCGHPADDHTNRPGVDVGWPCWHVEGDPCTCTRYVRPTK